MAAPLGNRFWEARSTHGRKPIFQTPEALWTACVEYFEWVEANPLYEAQAFAYQGKVKLQNLPKMRAMTIGGLCIFLDISQQAWSEYKKRKDYGEITTRADEIIRSQKFQGAAADLLNPNIIARDLGLADKRELTGAEGGPIETKELGARESLANRIAGLSARTGSDEGSGGTD